MTPTQTEQKLIDTITAHDISYYVRGKPTVTDADYDALMRQLRQIETELGRAKSNSPTQRVGSDLSEAFAKVKHDRPFLSLDNTFSPSEVQAFFGTDFAGDLVQVEAKIDGLAVELRYRDGLLVQALTRGDGSVGDDVTANARAIRAIPLAIDYKQDLSVRGEIYMRRSVFARLNAEREAADEDPFANPRNAAAGSLKQRSPAEVAKRDLSFIAYWSTLPNDYTQFDMTKELLRLGFPTMLTAPLSPWAAPGDRASQPPYTSLIFAASTSDTTELDNAINNIKEQRDDLDLEIDGAVVKLSSRAQQAEAGNRTKSPRWACAFKFPAERLATELLAIELTVGRTGQITPNARLKPLLLSGTTIENASLMNADELVRIGNPGIGDIVWVEKSAEIIPRIVGVKARRAPAPWQFPKSCPFCGTKLERRGVHWFDPNAACPERVYMRLRHATAKGALDWDGMGESQIRGLISQWAFINRTQVEPSEIGRGLRLSDLFVIDPASWGLKTAALRKFIAERERVKSAPLWRKLASLGIEDVGKTLSKELATRYGSLDNIVAAIEEQEAWKASTEEPKSGIRDLMGSVALGRLIEYLKAEIDDIGILIQNGFLFEDAARPTGPLVGKVLVITGTLMSGGRDQVAARIETAGGMVKGSVGRKTDYLVVGENPGAGKTDDAKKYGTTVIDEAELYRLIGIEMPTAPALPNLDEI